MLGFASCQTEPEGLNVQVGDEVDATITVAVADVETRAGSNSAKGVFDNGVLDGDATMRYVMRIYDENGNPTEKRYVDFSDEKSVTFAVRLAPNRAYTFVVWADVVLSNKDEDNHYDTYDLENITIIDTEEHPWKAMDESRDAFTGFATVGNYTSASTIQIPLTRPFAKLRVKTNDLADLALLKIVPAKATVTYTTDLSVAFNAVEGKAITPNSNANTITKTVSYLTDAYEGDSATLFTDYLIVDEGVVKFTMDVKQASGRLIKSNNFNTDIPVKRNCLTTISGNVLTDGNGISVNIEESEEETEWPKTMAEQLAYVGIVGGEVTLTEDVELTKPVVVNAGVNAVINLNNHSITNTTESETYGEGEGIIVYGNLTIKGEGTVQAKTMAVWARGDAGAEVNIYGGIYKGCDEGLAKGGRSVIYASGDNVINIYGGTFKALAADKTSYADKTNGVYAALNVQDNKGTINVYGGTFVNFNPAAPGTEPASWMQTHPNGFVVRGYKSEKVGDSETDYVVTEIPPVTTSEKLLAAFAEGGYVKLGNDIDLNDILYIEPGVSVLLDMNGKTIIVDKASKADPVFWTKEGGTLTIDGDGTVIMDNPYTSLGYPVGDIIIENGTFIRYIPDGYTGSVGSMFVGTKPAGGWESTGVTIKGGYFDSGYYDSNAADIDDFLAGTKTLVETDNDIVNRGQPGDKNKVRVALKQNVMKFLNRSNNYFHVYGGTFVGANPAWGDEGCMLPTTLQYLRPWSNYQGALIPGQEFHEDGIVLPEGFTITKGTHEDGRPTYTVTYNK